MAQPRRVFLKPGFEELAGAQPFDVPATLAGTTAHFSVYYETRLASEGATIATAVMQTCERDNAQMAKWFGIAVIDFNVIVLSNPSGAYHYGCKGADLYCDAGVPDHTRMLLVAEAVEVYEADQKKGWNCGASAGEGLSRVLSTELYPAQLDGFATANAWLNSPRADWVTKSKPTDTDFVSIGCSVLFLNYMRYQLGFAWEVIVQAGGSTLERTYQRVTKKKGGFAAFKQLIDQHFPPGQTAHLSNDNPFPL